MNNCFEFWKGWFCNQTFIRSHGHHGITCTIKTDNALAYASSKAKQIFAYYSIKYITGIPQNPTGQTVIERSNCTLKHMLNKQRGLTKTPETDYIMLY